MPCLVAHRGQKFSLPENTLESVKRAIDCGALAVEFDVQMTADHVPVICHDAGLLRTGGVDIIIADVDYADLKNISVGEPDRFAEKYQSVTLPALQTMVAMLQKVPQVKVFVELKSESIHAFGINSFLKPVVSQIQAIRQHCVVIADELEILLALKRQSSIATGWILHRWHDDDFTLAKQCNVDYLVMNHKYYRAEPEHDFAVDSWDWVMYESNDAEQALALFDKGVSFVETADICSMLKQLAQHE